MVLQISLGILELFRALEYVGVSDGGRGGKKKRKKDNS